VLAVALAGLAHPRRAAAQTVVQHDFEDGTTQGWIPRGSAILSNTTDAANTGSHSLKTTGRTAGFHGPSLSLLGRLSPVVSEGDVVITP
jgi:endo-1,4-beta-xylanase